MLFTLLTLPLHLPRQHVRNTEVKCSRAKFDLFASDLGPFVSRGVDPPDEVEVVDLGEGAEVCALVDYQQKVLGWRK